MDSELAEAIQSSAQVQARGLAQAGSVDARRPATPLPGPGFSLSMWTPTAGRSTREHLAHHCRWQAVEGLFQPRDLFPDALGMRPTHSRGNPSSR